MGYRVTAADMTRSLLDKCEERAAIEGVSDQIDVYHADARDLSEISSTDFDAGLLMGPLYHLISRNDRQKAISEVVCQLRQRAVFFSSHISRFGVLADLVKKVPKWIEKTKSVESLLAYGRDSADHPRDGSFRGYFATVEELPWLHEEMGIDTIAIASSDPGNTAINDAFAALPPLQRERWSEILFRVSTEPSFRGAWCHLLYIGKKAWG